MTLLLPAIGADAISNTTHITANNTNLEYNSTLQADMSGTQGNQLVFCNGKLTPSIKNMPHSTGNKSQAMGTFTFIERTLLVSY